MDIFTADTTSLKILRLARCGAGITLRKTSQSLAARIDERYLRLHKLGIARLCNVLRVSADDPLVLLVPSDDARRRCTGVRSVVRRRDRGEGSFLQVVSADDGEPSPLLPDGGRLFVESPASIVLTMAGKLVGLERAGRYVHDRSVLMLLKLCLELCGTYSHEPLDPWLGEVTYGVKPATSVAELASYLDGQSKVVGLPLAREVASIAFDRSGSPEESFMGPALFGRERYGGLDLGGFAANQQLPLSASQLGVLAEKRMTPDFSMPAYNIAVEFKGRVHNEGDNPAKDRLRSLDYQTVGWREFAFWYEDVRDQDEFNRSAARIVAAIGQFEGASVRKRFERMVGDPEFLGRQRTLFEVFRPWLREGST